MYRVGLGYKVKIRTYLYTTPSGETIEMSYISPLDLFQYLMENHPEVMVGGLGSDYERAQNLRTFWHCHKLHSGDHEVFAEYCTGDGGGGLDNIIPIAWHGDEGRGKRRGNTVCVSMEAVIGVETVLRKKRKSTPTAGCTSCQPPDVFNRKYSTVSTSLDADMLANVHDQWTTMKGHSFLQHFALFIIPSWVHHAHPEVLQKMLGLIAADFRRLFYEGVTVRGRTFCAAVTAAKGDLKWFCKIALERSFQNQGVVRDLPCCHECQAGAPGLAWEDMTEQPIWSATRYTQRPWANAPPMLPVPFCRLAPEKMYKRDPFHLAKVGIYRDLAGSCICWLVEKGYYGMVGDFPTKLDACHSVFKLFCTTTSRTAALRSFSRALFMYPRRSAYPWVNCKGSDTMHLLSFITVQCAGFELAPVAPAHLQTLKLMGETCRAAIGYFRVLNKHGLHLKKPCAMVMHAELTRFITGYSLLASGSLNDVFNGWGVKPKLHLMKHSNLEDHENLLRGHEFHHNPNAVNCEQCEDYIGRVCRLSRRLDSRRIGERVLQCVMLKSDLLWKRFKRDNGLK